ncbi:MAG: tRNA (N6-threonylcarbamoyladenosine(37)-N6)-methyltransferase TrmO [Sandaracinaceae bacterium]|nr:MAG: tRNA (N6-threonylcarbamoyladenosine(37)-N6)-methyltransferase TrmO [Sandaracinaceae bacterium]
MPRTPPPRSYTRDAAFPTALSVTPIGVIHSPHEERHGTPRQAALPADPSIRPEEAARLELFEDVLPPEAVRDLEGFDYVWILAWLHLNDGWNPTVIPPRGPRERRSLLATRAPHRPNPIGLSAARVTAIEGRVVHLERVDLLDGTPVIDVKPYIPAVDAFPDARAGWLDAL